MFSKVPDTQFQTAVYVPLHPTTNTAFWVRPQVHRRPGSYWMDESPRRESANAPSNVLQAPREPEPSTAASGRRREAARTPNPERLPQAAIIELKTRQPSLPSLTPGTSVCAVVQQPSLQPAPHSRECRPVISTRRFSFVFKMPNWQELWFFRTTERMCAVGNDCDR